MGRPTLVVAGPAVHVDRWATANTSIAPAAAPTMLVPDPSAPRLSSARTTGPIAAPSTPRATAPHISVPCIPNLRAAIHPADTPMARQPAMAVGRVASL